MSLHRIKGILLSLLLLGSIAGVSRGLASYTNSDLSTVAGNDVQAAPGDAGVFVGRLTLPTPATDTIITDGMTAIAADTNPLTAFAASNKFIDHDNDGLYDDADGIISSANAVFDRSDSIITAMENVTLSTFGNTESEQTMYGFIDADSDSVLDYGEDVVRQVVSGGAETLTSGDQIRPLDESTAGYLYYFTSAGQTTYDWNYSGAWIKHTMEGDVGIIGTGGHMHYKNFVIGDRVCVQDRDTSGGFSPSDAIWRDVNGSGCTTFQSGTDVVLFASGSALTGAASTLITGTELGFSIGYVDGNSDSIFNCTRASCEALLISFTDNLADDDFIPGNNSYLMAESVIADGIGVTGTSFKEDFSLLGVVDASTQTAPTGESLFGYVDTNGNFGPIENWEITEDVVMIVAAGTADALSAGDTFRTLGANDKYIDGDGDGGFDAAQGDVLIRSANSTIDVGNLNGTGTDAILTDAGVDNLETLPANTKYFDHNASGSYADGDDIVRDVDQSTYYNGDDLTQVTITSAGSLGIDDSDLTGLYLYRRTDTNCQSGGNVLIGSDTANPVLNSAITVTSDPFGVEDNVVLCLFADIANGAQPGKVFSPQFAVGSMIFPSGSSPEDTSVVLAAAADSVNIVSQDIALTFSADSYTKGATAAYTVSFSSGADLPDGGGVTIEFPEGYDISGSTMSCTANEVSLDGISAVDGQVLSYTLDGDSISAGDDVVCAVTGAVNPNVTGETGAFTITTLSSMDNAIAAEIDSAETATITRAAGGGGGGSYSVPAPEQVIIKAPVAGMRVQAGELLTVTWQNTSTRMSPYVTLRVRDGQGTETYVARNIPNNGSALIRLPAVMNGGEVSLIIETTDMLTVGATHAVTLRVAAQDQEKPPVPEELCSEPQTGYSAPVLAGNLVKAYGSPTVFYRAPSGILRPFFTEQLFFSWNLSFANVQEMSAQELSNRRMGAPMPPAPGTVLVKTPNAPEVYALEPNENDPSSPIFHWISTEEAAVRFFGSSWSEKIIDLSPAILQTSPRGNDLTVEMCEPWYIELYR